jgi:hypothetical protein
MAPEPAATAQYLAELFTSGRSLERLQVDAKRIRAATEVLAAAGEPIRYLDSLLLPDEETGLHRFEAEGPEAVERVLRDAGLEAERISPAIAVTEMRTVLADGRGGERHA